MIGGRNMLGAGVDPRLFSYDFSGAYKIGENYAQGISNLGQSIAKGIEGYGEAKEQRKKIDAQVKADSASIETASKLGDNLGIDIRSILQPIQDVRNDPNTTPIQSLELGRSASQAISNALTLGISAQERQSAQQRAMMEQQYKGAQLALESEKVDIARQKASQGPTPKFELRKPQIASPTGEVFEGPELPYDVNRGMYFDTKANKYIADPNLIGTGKEYATDSAMPTPTSQVSGSISDSIASAAEMNIGKLSTAKTPGTQGGNMGCADAICRTFEMATGEELVPGGTLSTREMATNLNNDPRFVKVPFNEAQKGDIVLTPRKGNKAGHTGIVLDGGKIASNSSKGFAGKSPGTFTQNYTMDSWGRNVAPRNPSETAAYRYVGSQGIDNALAMSGDMSSQAMGTQEQQAMAAQQIEQGVGMATAQNIRQGSMPTEPSMTTQQPQLPQQNAPQWSPPSGFVPKQGKFRKASPEEEAYYGTRGQVNLETGEFVAKRGQSSGFEVTTPEGTTVRYGGAGGLAQPKVGPGEQLVPDSTSPTGTRVVQIPGGEAEKASKQEAAAAEVAGKRGTELGLVALAEIDNFIDYTNKMSKLPFASPVRQAFATFGMEEQAEAESSLNTVKSNLKFEALDALRKSSPSGASGLGQVTQNEFSALAEQWGDLRLKGNPEKIKERAIRIKKQLLDVVHGSQAHRDSLLKKGSITQQQYNDIQSQYPSAKAASREDENLSRWRKTFIPQPTQ
jgi:hypothetical protein